MSGRLRTAIASALAALLLAGCATYTLVPAVGRQSIAGFYSVEPQTAWSRIDGGQRTVWTVDGPLLQTLTFTGAMHAGDTLYEALDEAPRPRVRAGMNASEVQEFVTDSLTAAGAVDVVAQGLRPMDFGGLPGFRFELRLRSPQGLEMAGIAAGVVHEDSLYLILFTGARAWYFPRLEPAVEAILASIRREA